MQFICEYGIIWYQNKRKSNKKDKDQVCNSNQKEYQED